MILEYNVTVAKAWLIALFICIVLDTVFIVFLIVACYNKNERIKSIETKTKSRMTDYYNTTMRELANNIHSFNAEAREREREEWNKEKQNLIRKLKAENPFCIKYELGQVVYIFKDNEIYKDQIREIKINKKEKTYTGIILKDIKEKYVYATFDELCNDNKISKDGIMMNAYNNNLDKKGKKN